MLVKAAQDWPVTGLMCHWAQSPLTAANTPGERAGTPRTGAAGPPDAPHRAGADRGAVPGCGSWVCQQLWKDRWHSIQGYVNTFSEPVQTRVLKPPAGPGKDCSLDCQRAPLALRGRERMLGGNSSVAVGGSLLWEGLHLLTWFRSGMLLLWTSDNCPCYFSWLTLWWVNLDWLPDAHQALLSVLLTRTGEENKTKRTGKFLTDMTGSNSGK